MLFSLETFPLPPSAFCCGQKFVFSRAFACAFSNCNGPARKASSSCKKKRLKARGKWLPRKAGTKKIERGNPETEVFLKLVVITYASRSWKSHALRGMQNPIRKQTAICVETKMKNSSAQRNSKVIFFPFWSRQNRPSEKLTKNNPRKIGNVSSYSSSCIPSSQIGHNNSPQRMPLTRKARKGRALRSTSWWLWETPK